MSEPRLGLTPEQLAAVECLDQDCLVSAGAGSGKTRVLVERYLHILEQDPLPPLDSIVAITFTEKAATEMKRRVRQGIVQRMENSVDQGEASRWHQVWTDSEQARITTIHSFCAGLLKNYPVEAGVEPRFVVMDEGEADRLLREVVGRVLPEWVKNAPRSLERMVVLWGATGTVQRFIRIYREMTGNGWNPEVLREKTLQHLSETSRRLKREQRDKKLHLLTSGQVLMDVKGGKRVQAFQKEWPLLSEQLVQSDEPIVMLSVLDQIQHLLSGNWGRKPEIMLPRNQVRDLVKDLSHIVEGWYLLPQEEEVTSLLLTGLEQVDQVYRSLKEERGVLDFDELQSRAVQLLQDHPRILRRLRSQIRYLMVDEYQDTNDAQKRLIDYLCPGPEGEHVPGKRFVVGDPKQSIYRFRGAEVSLFGKTREEVLSAGGREIALTDNFRSDKDLVDFVNQLFPHLMDGNPRDANHFRPAIAHRQSGEEPKVEYFPLPEESEASPREVEATWMASRIKELIKEGTEPGGIAVLLQTMTHVKVYEQAFIQYGIPFHVVKGKGFYDRQEIQDVIHYMRFLQDPGNTMAWIGLLRSPFCGVSDETLLRLSQREGLYDRNKWDNLQDLPPAEVQKLQHFIQKLDQLSVQVGRISVGELVERIIEETGYRYVMWGVPHAAQIQANLDKFLHMARSRQGVSSYSLTAVLQTLDYVIQEEMRETEAPTEKEEGDSVKLMTIHQSKGLEFPVVFLPDLSKIPNRDIPDSGVDKEAGLVFRLVDQAGEKLEPFRWREMKEKERKQEINERVRLFYVAVTRAEDRLILSGLPQKHTGLDKGDSLLSTDVWSKWLDGVLDYQRIIEDDGSWTFKGGGPVISVKSCHGGQQEERTESKTRLDGKWLEEAETVQTEWFDLAEPRGWRLEDRMEVSVTDLVQLSNCPRNYYYSRVLGMPHLVDESSLEINSEEESKQRQIGTSRREGSGSLSPRIRGDVVHRILELSFPSISEAQLDNLYHRVLAEKQIPVRMYPQVIHEVHPMIMTFLRSDLCPRQREEAGIKKEVPFLYQVDGVELEGIIDLLYCTSEGKWVLVDYKTHDITKEAADRASEEYEVQIQLYVTAAREVWGIEVDQAVLFFLKPNVQKIFEITPQWERVASETMADLTRLLRQGDKVDDFHPRPGKRCDYCGFQLICEAGKTV